MEIHIENYTAASIWNTGEIYATCWWNDKSISEETYGDCDDNEIEGLDPYMTTKR